MILQSQCVDELSGGPEGWEQPEQTMTKVRGSSGRSRSRSS